VVSEYYKLISTLDELVGDIGLLRLPSYIFEEFVFDEARRIAFETAIESLLVRENVLITGRAGVGKTALMAMVIKELFSRGYKVGYILEGAKRILNEHVEKGIILFYDDIPRMPREALRTIALYNVKGIVATAREEELDELKNKLGCPIEKVFVVVKIGKMSNANLKEILRRFARREGIDVEEGVDDILISKANNLPIYVWQAIRDLKIMGNFVLTKEFAKNIPPGMLNYVDDILWRVLDEHKDRYGLLLTLLIVSDLPKYEINSDLLVATFAECLSEIRGHEVSLEEASLNDLLGKTMRYLIKIDPYTFKLPHDSWGDVLKGKSTGLMSDEISKINTLYPRSSRLEILSRAISKVEGELLPYIGNEQRVKSFRSFVNRLGILVKELTYIGRRVSGAPVKTVELAITHDKPLYPRSLPVYKGIIENKVYWSVLGIHKRQLKKKITIKRARNRTIIEYPKSNKLRIEHTAEYKEMLINETKFSAENIIFSFTISLVMSPIVASIMRIFETSISSKIPTILLFFLVFLAMTFLIVTLLPPTKITERITIERLKVEGDEAVVDEFVNELKDFLRRKYPKIRIASQ